MAEQDKVLSQVKQALAQYNKLRGDLLCEPMNCASGNLGINRIFARYVELLGQLDCATLVQDPLTKEIREVAVKTVDEGQSLRVPYLKRLIAALPVCELRTKAMKEYLRMPKLPVDRATRMIDAARASRNWVRQAKQSRKVVQQRYQPAQAGM